MRKRLMALILLLTMVLPWSTGKAEDKLIYILCRPESYVNVRKTPLMNGEETGWLNCGDSVMTDGKEKNGFIHVYGITEYGHGWVYAGYVVDDLPVVEERCFAVVSGRGGVKARRNIGGRCVEKLDELTEIIIYARSEEWAVTNKGFIRTEFLDVWYE